MTLRRWLLALMFAAAPGYAQTAPVSGFFVSTLGNDTIAIERYTRSGDKIEGDVLYRTGRVRVAHYVADLTSGRFKGMAVTTRRVGTDPAAPPVFSMSALVGDSAATVDVQRNGRADTAATGKRAFQGRVALTVPGVPAAYGVYEQIIAFNPPPAADSIVIATPGAGLSPRMSLSRRGRDTVIFTGGFIPEWIEVVTVGPNGRIIAVDATTTTVKTITRRVDRVDFDSIARRWAAAEATAGAPIPLSVPDTARATIKAARVEVSYSRPARRGRTIFGVVVPWNQVWRTGANAATQLTTSADLMFGTTLLPAGKYTLWTLPTPSGAKLIINSQTGQWGTEYDEKRDLARLDLTQTRLAQPVEQFTIAMAPQGDGGILRMSWDNTEYSIPFRLK